MNKAAYIDTNLNLFFNEAETPKPEDDQVVIEIKYTGICGSDLHYYREGRVGENIIREPHILGHESSGVIVEIGKAVSDLKVGDRVTIEPGVPCLSCRYCLTGRYALCNSVKFIGAPPNHGTFRKYIAHKALFTHRLPDSVDLKKGALVEPFAVGYNAVSKLRPKPGESVLVIGAGPIGITSMLIAIASGAFVTLTDVDDYRLKIAESLGAHKTINVNRDEVPQDVFDYAVEASGCVSTFQTILKGCRKGANVAIVGMTGDELCFIVNPFIRKELSLSAVYRYANDFQPVLKLLEGIDTRGIISHEFEFNQLVEAFELNNSPEEKKMKVIIKH